jgi:predicted ATP-dependent endonuclease of OLD family
MKLIKVQVKNFRLLHDINITFNEGTTAIVGKNNSGKTSLTTVFNIFLNSKNIEFSDFSLESHKKFIEIYKLYEEITDDNKEDTLIKIKKECPKIQLYLTIKYDDKDNWTTIKPFFSTLEDNDEIIILCEFSPKSTENFLEKLSGLMSVTEYSDVELIDKISRCYHEYYDNKIKPYSEHNETDCVSSKEFNNLVLAKFINAQRGLDDGGSENSSKLSKVFHKQFDYRHEKDEDTYEKLLEALKVANENIGIQLDSFFSSFIGHFGRFGFPGLGDEKVTLKSQLKTDNLFKDNVKLFYSLDENHFPEKYNGLGYSNLIYIISQIIGFRNEALEKRNNLNLIFIEEPEAHMHPQMQSVFIKKINEFLNLVKLDCQVILTTHSSHILTNAKLDSIRHFAKENNFAKVRNLSELNDNNFLQQYLTLGIGDLFFADKAILVEGVVERILLPVFIEKIEEKNDAIRLSEQYITLVEVGGAYANKFKDLLDFLELKTLIITDIDSVEEKNKKDKNGKEITVNEKSKVHENCTSSNVILKTWMPKKSKISELLTSEEADKVIKKIKVTYQNSVYDNPIKCGRSFEESFIIENSQYIFDEKTNLQSIKYCLKMYSNAEEIKENSFDIQDFIDKNKKKTDFAFDLLSVNRDDWNVPTYIKEGLEWLAK